jgi:hypothetical protein
MNKFQIGDLVKGGTIAADYDYGEVIEITGNDVTVAWELSETKTTQDAGLLMEYPGNGYVIYPNSIGVMDLPEALRRTRALSDADPSENYRVEDSDTEVVVARFRNGEEL